MVVQYQKRGNTCKISSYFWPAIMFPNQQAMGPFGYFNFGTYTRKTPQTRLSNNSCPGYTSVLTCIIYPLDWQH